MSGERIEPYQILSHGEQLLYLKSIFSYNLARKFISQESNCLDLGCGAAYGTKLLSSSVAKIIGIDIDKKAIERANSKYGTANCEFKVYDGRVLPFADNIFDIVVSFQVIEHIKDDKLFVSEAWRVLKKSGIFILATPNRALRLPSGVDPWNVYHVREYYSDQLQQLLREKFSDVTIQGVTACDEVLNIELKRIKTNTKIISYDIFNLRRRLPTSITGPAVKVLNFLASLKKSQRRSTMQYDEQDDIYQLEDKVTNNSLDILGICRK